MLSCSHFTLHTVDPLIHLFHYFLAICKYLSLSVEFFLGQTVHLFDTVPGMAHLLLELLYSRGHLSSNALCFILDTLLHDL